MEYVGYWNDSKNSALYITYDFFDYRTDIIPDSMFEVDECAEVNEIPVPRPTFPPQFSFEVEVKGIQGIDPAVRRQYYDYINNRLRIEYDVPYEQVDIFRLSEVIFLTSKSLYPQFTLL